MSNNNKELTDESRSFNRVVILRRMINLLHSVVDEKANVKKVYKEYEEAAKDRNYSEIGVSNKFEMVKEANTHFIEVGNAAYIQLEEYYAQYENAATAVSVQNHADFMNMLKMFEIIIQQPGYTVIDYANFINDYTNSYVYLNMISKALENAAFHTTAEAKKLLERLPEYDAWKLRISINELRSIVNTVKGVMGLDTLAQNQSYEAADGMMSKIYMLNVTMAIERIEALMEQEKAKITL